jgi:hypothetical protein
MSREPKSPTVREWRITGNRQSKPVTVTVDAVDHNEAVRKGSNHPHMLVVRDCVLITGGLHKTA